MQKENACRRTWTRTLRCTAVCLGLRAKVHTLNSAQLYLGSLFFALLPYAGKFPMRVYKVLAFRLIFILIWILYLLRFIITSNFISTPFNTTLNTQFSDDQNTALCHLMVSLRLKVASSLHTTRSAIVSSSSIFLAIILRKAIWKREKLLEWKECRIRIRIGAFFEKLEASIPGQ